MFILLFFLTARFINAKALCKKKSRRERMEEMEVGKVTHFFSKIGVCVIHITKGGLKKGDRIHIKGATSDFEQTIGSMQINHKEILEAKTGDSIGLQVKEPVREHDVVYKVT